VRYNYCNGNPKQRDFWLGLGALNPERIRLRYDASVRAVRERQRWLTLSREGATPHQSGSAHNLFSNEHDRILPALQLL
jgi:hypothetical protein